MTETGAAVLTQLPVMEHFYTIQGEGFNTGKPCYFIRLGGCDVGCFWCDVKESWDAGVHPSFSAEEITGWVRKAGLPMPLLPAANP